MIYCKNKIGKVIIDDEFNINTTSQSNLDLIKIIMEDLKGKIAPENGSPTIILSEELKKYGFKILDAKVPVFEQVKEMVF